jgi:hypothetical protein
MAEDEFTVAWLRPGDRLVLGCHCGAVTTLAPADLVLLLGADAPLDRIGLRLRCARCGQSPCEAWFDWEDDRESTPLPNRNWRSNHDEGG